MNDKVRKRVALIEDEADIKSQVKETLGAYGQDIEILEATDAGEAMALLFLDVDDEGPDAVILDLMMPYGKAAEKLDADSDVDEVETGVRLLRVLRESEKARDNRHGYDPLWVAVITARNNPHLIQELRELLEGRGRIYLKPFNDLELEHDLAHVLGIESKVHPDLLPPGYMAPEQAYGGVQ